MAAKIWILSLLLRLFALSFLKQLELVIIIVSIMKIELLSPILVREQPLKEIFIQVLILHLPWDARLYSFAVITCMPYLLLLMINMQETEFVQEVFLIICQASELMVMTFLQFTRLLNTQERWFSEKKDQF